MSEGQHGEDPIRRLTPDEPVDPDQKELGAGVPVAEEYLPEDADPEAPADVPGTGDDELYPRADESGPDEGGPDEDLSGAADEQDRP
ncbi:hypothetical protein KG112_03095 [Nocardioides sp. zg-ZUI104]|uniref:hypothetical protein n=1 Tax=Nocardioides faecalis TaxID=2803858 RepID=UPI001BCC2F4D|nr:hypothetical protein [Nocardioides faecalis]MBS4751795.1 hypothetical protein [Nocardioides faecalis]